MGELWFQSLTGTLEARERLARDYYYYVVQRTTAHDEATVRLDPSNAEAHIRPTISWFKENSRRPPPTSRPPSRPPTEPGPCAL